MQTEDRAQERTAKISVGTLTAMVVGSMVGAGVFSLPSRFAGETGVLGALISWTIAGSGMLMLAFVFQRLAMRKPDLDSGVYAYAKAGFGEQGRRVFSRGELVIFVVSVIGAVIGVVALATGAISI